MFGASAPQTTRILGGRYRLMEIAGKGGMGVVWKAWDESVERQVAVKLVLPAHSDEEHLQRLARIERERRVLIELSQHPNVVTLFDILMDPIGYVMEWIEGYDLEDWLTANEGPRPPEVVASIFAPILDAVGYAHERGVVHRDLKPSNVYLQKLGDRVAVRVMDFGLARVVQQESNITTGRLLVGTPQYMAPEQVLGHASTGATDIYALGVMLFECLTGHLPLENSSESPIPLLLSKVNHELPSPREKYPELSPELEAVIVRATRREPTERFESCADFSEALFAAIPNMPSRTRPLIDAETLGQAPPLKASSAATNAPSLDESATHQTARPSNLDDQARSALYGYTTLLDGTTSGTHTSMARGTPSSENVTAAHPQLQHGPQEAVTASMHFPAQMTAVSDAETSDVSPSLWQTLRKRFYEDASPQERKIGAGVLVLAALFILLLPILVINASRASSATEAAAITLPKPLPPEDFNWLVRGNNASSAVAVAALDDYQNLLHAWNTGHRGSILDGHRESMRCYYTLGNMPRERVPLQPLVRASLGLPLAPFQPEEIYVTGTGRDYVTFVERGVAGDFHDPYLRVIQMTGGRNTKWRVNLETTEQANDCYETFETHLRRYQDAGPPPMPSAF